MSAASERALRVISAGLIDAEAERERSRAVTELYCKEAARLIDRQIGVNIRDMLVRSDAQKRALADTRAVIRGIIGAGSIGAAFARCCAAECESRNILPTLSEMTDVGDAVPDGAQVAYVTGSAADAAFEIFSRGREWHRSHADRVTGACDSVIYGDADYAILPVRSESGGKLRSFCRAIEDHDMKIVSAAEAGDTTYALCAASFGAFDHTPSYLEFSVSGGDALRAVIAAMTELGHTARHIESANGRYEFVFKTNGDIRPALLYLDLFHPDHLIFGLYDYAV